MIFVWAAFGGSPDYCKERQRQPLLINKIDFRAMPKFPLDKWRNMW